MSASNPSSLNQFVIRTGWQLLVCGVILLAASHSPSPVAKLAHHSSGVFFLLGLAAGVFLITRKLWRNGVLLTLSCLIGEFWIVTTIADNAPS